MFSGAVTITKEDSNIVIEVKYLSDLTFIIIKASRVAGTGIFIITNNFVFCSISSGLLIV